MKPPLLSKYVEGVRNYKSRKGVLPGSLLISNGPNGLSTYYAPFEYINQTARFVICGITPGWQQADRALVAARAAIVAGEPLAFVLRKAKSTGSFAGAMRQNLSKMLDFVGIGEYLGIRSCSELFGHRSDLVHYTSALRFPVFKHGQNYSGGSEMVREPYLWDQTNEFLVQEIETLPDAVWLPLGRPVIQVFEKLVSTGQIDEVRVLFGMPHASGANAERIKYFCNEKPREQLSNRTNPDSIDEGRRRLLDTISRLP